MYPATNAETSLYERALPLWTSSSSIPVVVCNTEWEAASHCIQQWLQAAACLSPWPSCFYKSLVKSIQIGHFGFEPLQGQLVIYHCNTKRPCILATAARLTSLFLTAPPYHAERWSSSPPSSMGTSRSVQLLCQLNFTQLSVQPCDNCREEEKAQAVWHGQ